MIVIVRRPDVILGIDAQPVGMVEEAVAEFTEIFAIVVELAKHRLAPLEDEDVA